MDNRLIQEFLSNPAFPKVIAFVLTCFFFGGFGGLVAHFINNEKSTTIKSNTENHTLAGSWYSFPSYFQSICIGACGAIGFIFFINAVGGISGTVDEQQIFRVVSSSVIAGFGARSLLSKMAGQLEKQVAEARSMAEEAVDEAKANDVRIKVLEANLKLTQAAHPHSSSAMREDAIQNAKKLISSGNDTSGTWVNLARVYRWNDDLASAISTLTTAISKMKSGELAKDNLSPAHYNRGCYNACLYEKTKDRTVLASALDDLKTALDLAIEREAEIDAVWNDDDWNHLANEEGFIAIVGQKK